jgi:predicted permease
MKPGVSREQAGAELTSIAMQLEKEYPGINKDGRIRLQPLKEEIVGNSRAMLMVLLGAVGFVLLIACVNVANLLLVRSSARQREMAVRAALGAGRRRLARLALTESLLLATFGAALGLLLAYWGVDALLALAKRQLPRITSISIDGRVLGVALGVAFVTGILFGLAPVLQALRVNLNDSLKQGRPTSSVHRRRLDGALVVTEIAVAFILLVGAGLLIRSFWALQKQDAGFRPERVITATINLPGNKYRGPDAGRQFMTNLISRLESQSVVEAAGISSDVPWTGYNDNSGFDIVGQPLQPGEVRSARYRFATPGYFKAMSVPAIQGRPIEEGDHATARPVVVINATFASKYFHGADPVGRQLDVWGAKRTIAGVLADVKDSPAAASATPTFYFPAAQMPMPGMALSVRTKVEPTAALETIRRTVLEVDPELALGGVRTMDQIASDALSTQRFTLALVILFAAVAAALAAIGIYGVIAYSVAQRIREFGIRIALGATRRDILAMVLSHATRLGGAGIAIGLIGALLVSKGLSTLLYGVSERDPLTLVSVAILSAAIALLACSIPARRAARTEPVIALRHE